MIERRVGELSISSPTIDATPSSELNRRVSRRRLLQGIAATAATTVLPLSFENVGVLAQENAADSEVETRKSHRVLTVILDNSPDGVKEELLQKVQNALTGTDMQPDTDSYIAPEEAINKGTPSFSILYDVATKGKISFNLDTILSYRINPSAKSQNYYTIAAGGTHLAEVNDGVDRNDFDMTLFILHTHLIDGGPPAGADPYRGFCYVDGLENLNGRRIAHEVAHLLGLGHAGQFAGYLAGYRYTEPIMPYDAKWNQYGDLRDIMGNDEHGRWGFNIVHREKLGLIEDKQIQEVTESGTYFVASEPTADKPLALKIPVPQSPFDYYVSYPAPLRYPGDDLIEYERYSRFFQLVHAHLSWLGIPLQIGQGGYRGDSPDFIRDEKNNIFVSTLSKEHNEAAYGNDNSMMVYVSLGSQV